MVLLSSFEGEKLIDNFLVLQLVLVNRGIRSEHFLGKIVNHSKTFSRHFLHSYVGKSAPKLDSKGFQGKLYAFGF